MLEFNAETTRILDNGYRGADVTRRRRASFDALAPRPGDTIVDIGCGSGLLAEELAKAVGPEGRVIGIDPSPDMLEAARAHCAAHDHVALREGLATGMPLDDDSVDRAVSVQVFEYIEDVEGACAEAVRILRPGGRLVISDMHFGTFTWFSDDPARMERMMASWDAHFISGTLPARLPAILRDAGCEVEAVTPVPFCDHLMAPDGLAVMMMHLMRGYAIANGHVDRAEADAWFDEQVALAAAGRFFFSITQFVVTARKR